MVRKRRKGIANVSTKQPNNATSVVVLEGGHVSRITLWELVAAGSVFILLLAFAWRNVQDLDFGSHLATGRWILEHLQVPHLDTFTYTRNKEPYVAYHWLFQVCLYVSFHVGSYWGVALYRLLLLLATAGLIAYGSRLRKLPVAVVASAGILTLVACEWRFAMRPELFSFLGLAATLVVHECARQGRYSLLWWLVLIQLVWINTHVFLLGWIVSGSYLLEAYFEGRIKPYLKPLIAAVVVLLLNPYHLQAIVYPFLLLTRMDATNVFAGTISELRSPFALAVDASMPFGLQFQMVLYKLSLGLAALGAVRQFRERRWAELLVLLLFGGLSTRAVRNIPLFFVAGFPAICQGFLMLVNYPLLSARVQKFLLAVITLVALLTSARVLGNVYYYLQRRPTRSVSGVSVEALPLLVCDWLAHQQLMGAGFNDLNSGSTLIWRNPNSKVFIDGRNEVTGEAFFIEYLKGIESEGWDTFAQKYQFEYVILSHQTRSALVRYLVKNVAWKMVYFDHLNVVFVRVPGPNSHVPQVQLPAPVVPNQRSALLQKIELDTSLWSSFWHWAWWSAPNPGTNFALGTGLLLAGEPLYAEAPLLQQAVQTPQYYEVLQNLGALYYRMRLWYACHKVYALLLALGHREPPIEERFYEAEAHLAPSILGS